MNSNLNSLSVTLQTHLGGGYRTNNIPIITFFEFRRLVSAGELEGVLVAENARSQFTKSALKLFKLYDIPKVGVMDLTLPNPVSPIYWLDSNKAFIAYLNSNIVDVCNLNCKGCTHFAPLFNQHEIYSLDNFKRDVRRLSQICDVVSFRFTGGEPLLVKNLDEYVKLARQHFPKSNLGIVTNGLILPSAPQKLLNTLRDNNFVVYISVYPPTLKILDKIKAVLDANKIFYQIHKVVETFGVFLTLHYGNNPERARKFCVGNDICRFMRDGKIYKCPPDALKFRLAEKFGIEGLPAATGIDLYALNFSSLLQMLDGNIEMCHWCSEQKTRRIPWEPSKNPKLEDWLADPDELKKFIGG